MIVYIFGLFKAQFVVLSVVFAKRSFPAMLTDIFRTGAKSVQNIMVLLDRRMTIDVCTGL